jgi:hypothetical protein
LTSEAIKRKAEQHGAEKTVESKADEKANKGAIVKVKGRWLRYNF